MTNRKIFDKFDEIKSSHPSWFFNNFTCNFDTTQISYYEKNDYYGAHTDASILTALTWFYKEPKKFQGGDIFFTDYDLQHSIQNNSTLIFPSCIKHSVSTIEMGDENLNKRLGRFCMAQFFQIKSEH